MNAIKFLSIYIRCRLFCWLHVHCPLHVNIIPMSTCIEYRIAKKHFDSTYRIVCIVCRSIYIYCYYTATFFILWLVAPIHPPWSLYYHVCDIKEETQTFYGFPFTEYHSIGLQAQWPELLLLWYTQSSYPQAVTSISIDHTSLFPFKQSLSFTYHTYILWMHPLPKHDRWWPLYTCRRIANEVDSVFKVDARNSTAPHSTKLESVQPAYWAAYIELPHNK